MAPKRFFSPLPESMSIEDAVRAMIEGDERVKLPMCYETFSLPFFDRLAECCHILERRYDSALEYEIGESHQVTKLQFEAMEKIQQSAQLYREDLKNLADADTPDLFPGPTSSQAEEITNPDHQLVNRSFLVPWAYKAHGVDIHGFHTRQQRALDGSRPEDLTFPVPTDQDPQAWAQKNLLSGDRLWQLIAGDQTEPLPQHSEGQILFLSIAWLLDTLLSNKHGDWRRIVTDETANTSNGFFIKGRLNIAALARAVAAQLPEDAAAKDPTKAIKGHILSADDFLAHGPEFVLDYSVKQKAMAYRTLYGLARAAWKAITDHTLPDRREVAYPPHLIEELIEGLPSNAHLPAEHLAHCLEDARRTTAGLFPTDQT